MLNAILPAIIFGLSAGLIPGPSLTLILTQSLRYGPREGYKVALVPLVTDLPSVFAALVFAASITEMQMALGGLSIMGSLFLVYLSIDTFRATPISIMSEEVRPQSWLRGITVGLLNPHPWLFWMTIGAATLTHTIIVGSSATVVFLVGFYVVMIGSQLLLASLIGYSRELLSSRTYRITTHVLGVLQGGFAILLFLGGLRYLECCAGVLT
uniref:Threonine/homoserine/homoserine lactone efflux protein n=1 Tax=Candidatus Kentrum sp. LPFa TaxID=2126335 RepID=A0A450VZI8_9GAMM|nr:MAG: Threonine/homoserine/homoserine lactone efflux protein [Candidatus Kentron sp. LPFa]VFK28456.1 MAG: Threonine/homoserine/homoserine lactone efflux protein [Candidatus Kentron sp. LPFa]